MPANNRWLRLTLIMRKNLEMGKTVKLVTEYPDEPEQHRFNEKSMALPPIAMVVSAATLHYVLKILLNLIKSYDLVQRDQVTLIVDKGHSVETAGLVASILQPSIVATIGDETKLIRVVNVRLTQGGPASPALYKKTENVLIRCVLFTLKIFDDGCCTAPLKACAYDIALQLESDVYVAIALRASGGWATDLLMKLNMKQCKSPELIQHSIQQSVRRTLGGEAVRGSQYDKYL